MTYVWIVWIKYRYEPEPRLSAIFASESEAARYKNRPRQGATFEVIVTKEKVTQDADDLD